MRFAAQRVLAQAMKAAAQQTREMASTGGKPRKVAVLGAAGGIGQPLSLLMKVGYFRRLLWSLVSACSKFGVPSSTAMCILCCSLNRTTFAACVLHVAASPATAICCSTKLRRSASAFPQMNPAVSQLSLYDVANTKGVAADCSHINSRAQVQVRAVCSEEARLCGSNESATSPLTPQSLSGL